MGNICSWYVAGSVELSFIAIIPRCLHSLAKQEPQELLEAVQESFESRPIQCTGTVHFSLC